MAVVHDKRQCFLLGKEFYMGAYLNGDKKKQIGRIISTLTHIRHVFAPLSTELEVIA